MVRNREEAARRAEASTTNTPLYCQLWTRLVFDAPGVGDQDGDGSADAEDGWKSEPLSARHLGDRTPPRGVPVTYSGGSNDNWHRAVSLGGGLIRSTDAGGGWGKVGTVDIGWPERHWGMKYVGWSETISGIMIPMPPAPKPTAVSRFLEGGPRYELKYLDRAVARGRTGVVKDVRDEIDRQVRRLRQIDGSPRINKFLRAHRDDRLLKIGLLNKAIQAGRTGIVKDVRGKIMLEIHRLPRR